MQPAGGRPDAPPRSAASRHHDWLLGAIHFGPGPRAHAQGQVVVSQDDPDGAIPEGSILIDTSAWIPVLRRQRRDETSPLRARIDGLLADDVAATTGVVRTELLVGTRDDQAYAELNSL